MRIGKSLRNSVYVLAAMGGALGVAWAWQAIPIPSYETVRREYRPSDRWVVDRHGVPLESVRIRSEKRSLDWVEWSEVSPAFRESLVQAEDHRFYSHPGVDVWALGRATWRRLTGGSRGGASTISMQLAGLLRGETSGARRGIVQKMAQIAAALKLGQLWSKEQVLEAYVNLVPLRGELSGLRAASLGYFAKNPAGLTREESALLVALVRSPNASPEQVGRRACRVLSESAKKNAAQGNGEDCTAIFELASRTLSSPYRLARTRESVPVVSERFIERGTSSSLIETSLEAAVQQQAMSALREQLLALKAQNVQDGAVLVLETQTGRVVAYVANAGAGVASAEQVDGVQTRRQAGSTLKPFVYATALDLNVLQARSLLEDSPADISVGQGRVYHPKNYDPVFRGLVNVGDALGSSLNVPAVRALGLVGEARVLDRLRRSGFDQLEDDDFYGPSLALGAVDVTLWELTQGYRQFALESSVFSESSRRSIFKILSSPEHRRLTFGMDSLLSLPFRAAVKTGTSKDMRDNWCIGWTSRYTVGAWVGNFKGEPMWNVSGMSGAAPIWRSLMLALHPVAPTLDARQALADAGEEADARSAPTRLLPARTISRIRYPAPYMLLGLDPDIPSKTQKLPIEIDNPRPGDRLFLNERLLGRSKETTLWPLKRGQYVVELRSADGQAVDSVRFVVR